MKMGGQNNQSERKKSSRRPLPFQSTKNFDKTHLSNPLIAAAGSETVAPPKISSSRSRNDKSLSDVSFSSLEEETTSAEFSKTKRYNDANFKSTNGSDSYGVGYIDELEYENEDVELGAAPEHEEVCVKVMSHNFGKAKEQLVKNDSTASLVQNNKSLEAAYMSMRQEEVDTDGDDDDDGQKGSKRNKTKSKEKKETRKPKGTFLDRIFSKGKQQQQRGGREAPNDSGKGGLLHLCSKEEHEENLKILILIDFAVWDYSQRELVTMCWSIFHDCRMIEEFQIPAEKFQNFITAIFSTSHKVPYHNYFHYFSVLRKSWLFLRTNPGILSNLTKTDVLGCLTGAIGHDADHPGLTNSFLCATKSDLSIRYNDLSVLENHHCATTYSILQREECNIFVNLSDIDWKATRNVIVSAILNTDMARHFNLVSNFVKMFKGMTSKECTANRNLRNQIISMVVHCADISNPTSPWFVAKRFADCVAKEFRQQVEQEKIKGIPCTPHMLGLDKRGQAKMELGFIDVFTWPAMEALNSVLPNMDASFDNMEQNRNFWQDIMESYNKSKV
jgi:hypothetical protein